ncbi:hypothetical protein H8356DRAFT_1037240 [Neocallimastix lanati (nom. inval.)]|uniref:Uncharacterized protein n=1 Tax=Neocallimastix californiae TaxID=1754190 RepID=A0A1Y2D579_9FUNG|nr:hypothetical protein H8356DRAFT_1037240 [Neocallimastix sp. JGI-2020a]ORY54442.1 hypothetical protein LY90DRAFT_702366 [Neocallimastix californiae]|eukprot:ORY54442.1 hypothetical protein LY90DRAFT_702366 [Neocallimastix californiae]
MKIINLLYFTIGFVSVSLGAVIPVYTSSGNIVPEPLLTYLDCPIGDIVCKDNMRNKCTKSKAYKICMDSDPLKLEESLSKKKIDIGDYNPYEYCRIHNKVCDMIESYNKPLTKDLIFDIDKYLTCKSDDDDCKLSKGSTCRFVVKMCWGNYPKKACKKLSETCEKIED